MSPRTALALLLLTLPATAQGRWSYGVGPVHAWPPPSARTLAYQPIAAESLASSYEPYFGSLLVPPSPREPLSVERSELEAAGELEGTLGNTAGFNSVPGGVVLGLTAIPAGDWSDHRLELEAGRLALVASDGTRHVLPEAPVETLAACLAFASRPSGADAVIDIFFEQVRLAPEFRGTALAEAIERADRAPMTYVPGAWQDRSLIAAERGVWHGKALIVDRALRFGADPEWPGRVRFDTELEIRFYEPRDSWNRLRTAHRYATYVLERGGDGTARLADAPPGTFQEGLAADVQPLVELAGWLGFFRWAKAHDPERFEAVRRGLDRALEERSMFTLVPVR